MDDPRERRIGLAAGGILAAVMFFFAREFRLPDRILFSLSFGWSIFNLAVYRGRYRPRIVFAVKTAYPIMLFILYMAAFGK